MPLIVYNPLVYKLRVGKVLWHFGQQQATLMHCTMMA